ncbi:MAG: flagellin [Cyanobacteria bacterium NC_groundwater_1444_Ag_S-0.65um_54_12]|nr:flagellin [Cyanobacteria bacterium NC_groundwater_1444_Ag_S-0.65um_54_12]
MALRIYGNVLALQAYRQLKLHDDALAASIRKLSSGQRINQASDDPAGLSMAGRMRTQVRSLEQAVANVEDTSNMLNTADGALSETTDILQRMRELAVQAANDSLTASDRTSIKQEIDNMTSEIDRIANDTEYNNHRLLEGGNNPKAGDAYRASLFTIQVGPSGGNIHTFSISDMRALALNVSTTQTSVDTAANASTTINNIDIALGRVSTQQGYLGAKTNALAHNIAVLEVQSQNISASESNIRDVDFAAESARLARTQILQQSASAMLVQANASSQYVLDLFSSS